MKNHGLCTSFPYFSFNIYTIAVNTPHFASSSFFVQSKHHAFHSTLKSSTDKMKWRPHSHRGRSIVLLLILVTPRPAAGAGQLNETHESPERVFFSHLVAA